MAEMTSYAIGIDLGTTNSVVGVFRNGKVEIIANDFGNRTTPSIVGFDNFEQLIGDPAKQQMINNPENTIYDCKRVMGKSFANDDLRQNKAIWPFHVIHTMGKPKYIVKFLDERKEFSPEQISSMILLELKQRAEKYLGNPVKYAVITVPAYFNDLQRKATKEAAKIAKLNVLSIINEPTAAAIAYGFENVSNDKRNILIFHLGGGTFDVSILEIEKMNFEVIATGGDIHLGGEDFDNRLVQHFLNEMKLKHNHIDLCKNKRALAKLRQACEGAKKTLALQTVAKIEVDSLTSGFDFKSTISRALFEELNADLFRSTLVTMEKVLSDADLRINQIDEIVLVGGSTRILKIQQLVKNFFNGKEPVKSMNPEEEIAIGAAIEAAKLHESIPQEEIVELKFDVTFFNLGLGIGDDLENMHTMIPRNKKAPATNTAGFLTLYDNQTEIDVKVYLGESSLTAENILIGELRLCDIPPASEQFIEVTFDIDCHGILKVTAFIESTENELILIIDTTEYLDDGQRKKLIEQSQKRNELERARKALQQKENTSDYLKSARFKLDEILFGEVDDYEIFEIALECAEISNWIIMNENHANKEMFEEKKKHLQNRWYDLFNEELVQLPKPF